MIHNMNHAMGETGMTQLTIRSDDRELIERLEKLCREEGVSLNQAALRLMKKGAGLEESATQRGDRIGSSLDEFIGTWTDGEAEELNQAVEELEKIDKSLWE
jgi:hypothetical protein